MYISKSRQNYSQSQQNILANSIREARQKLLHPKIFNVNFSAELKSEEKEKNATHTAAAATAIKILRKRVSEVESQNKVLKDKNDELNKLLIKRQRQVVQTCSSVRSKNENESEKRSLQETKYKLQQLESYQMMIEEKQKQLSHKELIISSQSESIEEMRKVQKMLQQKISQLNKRDNIRQKAIAELVRDVKKEKEKNKQSNSKSKSQFPIIVEEPIIRSDLTLLEQEKVKTKSFKFKQQQMEENQFSIVSIQNAKTINKIKSLKQKNEELYRLVKQNEKKYKTSEKEKKQIKQKFYKLKNLVNILIQDIYKLPHHISQQLKLIIVKINKLDDRHLQCLRSHSSFRVLRSPERGSSSKDRSSSRKALKMSDLNMSGRSSRQRSESKSRYGKRSGKLLESLSGKKSKEKKEQKNKNMDIKQLQKQIRLKRNQITKLTHVLEHEKDSESAKELQDKLNNLYEEQQSLRILINNIDH